MKKRQVKISSQDDFNKHLQHTSPFTWVTLGVVVALLIALFSWSCLYKISAKLTGQAEINGGAVTLHINDSDLNKLAKGQKVYIDGKEGEIVSFLEDKHPVVSSFALADGEYTYTLILKEVKPIDFLFGK